MQKKKYNHIDYYKMKIFNRIQVCFLFLLTTVFPSCSTNINSIVAHRGAWKRNNLPENSIAALRHAIDLKLPGSEFDVWRTDDDSLVINHDAHEYISEGKRNNKYTLLVCEIKPSEISKERGKITALKAVETIKKLKAHKNTCYISFDYDILKEIRKVDSKTVLQYLEGNKSPKEVKADKINGVDYHYSVFKKHPEWIQEAKENKMILNVWTVNEAIDMDWIIDYKFNYITTNEPELLIERLKVRSKK